MTTAAAIAPIRLGRVISNTFAALRQNLVAYLLLALIFCGVPSLVIGFLFAQMAASSGQGEAFQLNSLQNGVEGIFAYPLYGAVILGVVAHMRGQRLSLEELWKQGVQAWGALFALGFMKGLRVGVGILLLIVPGLIWAIMWVVALPVKLIEKRPISACLDRSSLLTKGRRWPIVALILIYVVGIAVAGVVLGLVGGALIAVLSVMGKPWEATIRQIVSALINMVTDLFGAAGGACLYFELKTTREGDDSATVAAVFA